MTIQEQYIESIADRADIYQIVTLYKSLIGVPLSSEGQAIRKEDNEKQKQLFTLIKELSNRHWDPTKGNPLPIYNFCICGNDLFELYLNKESRKIYNRTKSNTIIEFWDLIKREKTAHLVQYISLEAEITPDKGTDYYLLRLGKLFNNLVKRGIIKYCVLGNAMMVPLQNNKVCFSIFPVTVQGHQNELNKLVGFEVFVMEGNMVANFDWTQIDKLNDIH
jgi:hypothetical protein